MRRRSSPVSVALLILSPEGLGAARRVEQSGATRHEPVLRFGAGDHLLTVPAVTIIATLTGQTLIFGLQTPHIVVMLTVLLLCQLSFSTGRTNVLNGTAHGAVRRLHDDYLRLIKRGAHRAPQSSLYREEYRRGDPRTKST